MIASVDVFPTTSVRGAEEAAAGGRAAQCLWNSVPLTERLRVVRRFRQLLAERAVQVAEIMLAARGAAVAETLSAEVLPLADACRFLERNAAQVLRPLRLGLAGRPWWLVGTSCEIHREPVGLVLIIAPGNFPLFLAGVQVLQALVGGNAVLLKPAEGCSGIARWFADLLNEAGLPIGLLQILGESPSSAQAAIEHEVDKVWLTGSAKTGAHVLEQLAGRLVPSVMELSGNDAAIVCADADLDLVTKALMFAFRLRDGQTCIAPRRVFVPSWLRLELQARLVQAVDAGEWTFQQSNHVRSAADLIVDALERGAKLVAGQFSSQQELRTPVVLTNVPANAKILENPPFAPVVVLIEVESEAAAVKAAGASSYALGATVFGSERRGRKIARQLRAGVVMVNDVIVPTADPRIPFGGRGRSGFGVTRGAAGLLEFTAIKAISVRRGKWRPHLDLPQPGDADLIAGYLQAVHGKRALAAGLWRAWRALSMRGERT
ncbi:MAG TPA: aldehyde dehydrogenase family protein [Planctomycetaceae bacterium]|nr:aldehyde dehydrogenase family protein [Planctomycetaceae bacterium]